MDRFIAAQNLVYSNVLKELQQGQKQGHWMWYIFPQIKGLGSSTMAQKYALGCAREAKAYLTHPVLGSRLKACTQLVLDIKGRSVEQIFAYPDDLKFHSCLTLFAYVARDTPVFAAALDKYFGGKRDQATLTILAEVGD